MSTFVPSIKPARRSRARLGVGVLSGLLLLVGGFLIVRPGRNVRPNILLVTIDTERADHLGCYGHAVARTPVVDGLAAEGLLFRNCVASAPITLPSHATIMTGLLPPAHGVRDNGVFSLDEKAVTLAERLRGAGYETRAFVSGVVLNRRYGLAQGFDGYDDDLWAENDPKMFMIRERKAAKTIDRALEWLEGRAGKTARRPFFAWVHLFDPHQPYNPPAWTKAVTPTPYDGEIAYADSELGRLVAALRDRGLLDKTVVVYTADHGESLGEHGEKTHAIFIYEATVRVPLVIRYPRLFKAGTVYAGPVRHVDIVPSILSILHKSGTEETQGVDLTPVGRGRTLAPDLPQYSESRLSELGFGMAPLYGVRLGTWKWIRAPKPELYDLQVDPRELSNVQAANPELAAKLDDEIKKVFQDSRNRALFARTNPLTAETMEMLQSLGYLAAEGARESMGGMDPKDGIGIYNKLEDARHAARKNDWAAAEKGLRGILAEIPGHQSARNILALTLLREGRIDEAKAEYAASLAADPGQARVFVQLANIALLESRLDEAEDLLQKALKITPGFVEAYSNLGLIASLKGDDAAAQAWYGKAVAVDPEFPAVYRRVGDLRFEQGDWAKALDSYKKAVEKNPRDYRALVQAGNCCRRLGRLDEAEGFFRRAAQAGRGAWVPHYNLACLRSVQGLPAEAAEEMRQALKRGFNSLKLLTGDGDLAALRASADYAKILEAVRTRQHDVDLEDEE
ncbi:MAG: sulfatase-like hydrolase/transferase [Acidobacteriota bacterium]|nr:sulfatase-like hydrolase/transferase [Acidobacteriota bacterium]